MVMFEKQTWGWKKYCTNYWLPFPRQALVFTCLQYKSFENTVGKEEIARNEKLSFSHSDFYPFEEYSATFIKSEIVALQAL